jgi:potassium efflux system protein
MHAPAAPEFVTSLGRICLWLAKVGFCFYLLWRLTKAEGVAVQHFRLPGEPVRRFHRAVGLTALVYLPAMLLTWLTLFIEEVDAYNRIGRVAFMTNMLWLMGMTYYVLNPRNGIFSERMAREPGGWLSHLRYVWLGLILAHPVALFIATAAGYFLSAINHQIQLENAAMFAIAGLAGYFLVSRWIFKEERRHMLEERLKQWSGGDSEQQHEPGEDVQEAASMEVEQAEISMERISKHTRNLLQFAVQIGVIALIWYIFSGYLTALHRLDSFVIAGSMSWKDLLLAVIILIPTIILVKNTPGLLEGVLLRHLPLSPGTRYAIFTLFQYFVLTVGIIWAIAQLGVDWSVLGWAAAALSVGIGFGLQEVVSNFICGLILLFERPIRVGDVVTMGDTTGVVSRIQIRATTITNWDRQEVVIPNKAFIIERFTNWTLSNPVNRVVITIGVAYGSDVGKGCQILRDVAQENEFIVDDPEPLVTFEEFGDSTLNLILRCYLPDMDNRLTTISELNSQVNRRFNEAGIEIAFPQRDLHIRSIDTSSLKEIWPEPPKAAQQS